MTVQVRLQDIVESMESSTEENLVLLNITNGKMIYLLQNFSRDAEDEKQYHDLPDWQQEQMILAKIVLNHAHDYVALPSKFDINKYEIMEKFCYIQSDTIQNQLLNTIREKGAFRRFKTKIYDIGLEDSWCEFRDKEYENIAIDFCNRYKLKYI